MKLLRTIRLDPSDRFIFERAAEPGEWAVPGGFAFFDVDPAALEPVGVPALPGVEKAIPSVEQVVPSPVAPPSVFFLSVCLLESVAPTLTTPPLQATRTMPSAAATEAKTRREERDMIDLLT